MRAIIVIFLYLYSLILRSVYIISVAWASITFNDKRLLWWWIMVIFIGDCSYSSEAEKTK